MRFKDDLDTVECEDCGREINVVDDNGFEDESLCKACSLKRQIAFENSICPICKKKIGKTSEVFFNTEEEYQYAHKQCVETLSEKEQCDWSDDWNY